MTVHIYNCETVTIRSELVQRTKPEGKFYGLRLHMNTDQTITFWSRSHDGLRGMLESAMQTLLHSPSECASIPGQMSR